MNQTQLFMVMLLSVVLCISGWVQFYRKQYAMAAMLFAIPACGWISIYFGK